MRQEDIAQCLTHKDHASAAVVDASKRDMLGARVGKSRVFYMVKATVNGQDSFDVLSEEQWGKLHGKASVKKQRKAQRRKK